MLVPNFAFHDLLGSLLAFLIFPVLMLLPGYIIGQVFDLFDFRQRQILNKYVIALIVSVAFVPVLVYLCFLISPSLAGIVIAIFAIAYLPFALVEYIKNINQALRRNSIGRYKKTVFFMAIGWVVFVMFAMVDIQWGRHLYNTIVSLDFATRVTLVNAITRGGIPLVNPSYFPGHPEYITSLYYFWYILCSVVDRFGGNLVDARMALIAGDAWCGLALMALVAWYLKLRNQSSGSVSWQAAKFGISLLLVSGLDIIPALISMLVTRFSFGFTWPLGDVEQWNEQITAWVGSLLWVPHHVAAFIACMVSLLIIQYHYQKSGFKKIGPSFIAGLALASAVGLSTWVAVIFSIFWCIWILVLMLQKKERNLITLLIFVGVVALIFASPFLSGVLAGGTGAIGSPVALEVRKFAPISAYISRLSGGVENIVYLLFLPVNYLFELGFFSVVGFLWLQKYRKNEMPENPFYVHEIILFCVVIVVCSFVRSTIVATNEIGWRGWLFGQFVLLIWATDIYPLYPYWTIHEGVSSIKNTITNTKLATTLTVLLLIGVATSVVDVVLLRVWPILVDVNVVGFPNGLSPDAQLGQRTFAARLAYEYIRDELSSSVVVQQNPLTGIDRPSGLYGTRQMAISSNAPYNVELTVLENTKEKISEIFLLEKELDWRRIDALCVKYYIDVLVVNDLDPLWGNLPYLYSLRPALYKNNFYSVLACGDLALER